MLVAARDANVRRFVYAASSSTYGDHPGLPKVEDEIGAPLSPYAVTKLVNELYADVFGRCYGIDDDRPALLQRVRPAPGPGRRLRGRDPALGRRDARGDSRSTINGDGETTRDFCYVANVVQANLLAATDRTILPRSAQVYNVAVGGRMSLNELYRDPARSDRRAACRRCRSRRRSTTISAPATSATRRPTSARRAGCWATSPRIDRARDCADALPWYERSPR